MCQKFTADEPNTMDHRKAHQSETAKGLAYSINQEEYLKVFLTDGEVPIDDSASERTLRDFTIWFIFCKSALPGRFVLLYSFYLPPPLSAFTLQHTNRCGKFESISIMLNAA